MRRAFDYYRTPEWMTRALLRRVPAQSLALGTKWVFDPCAGDGAISNVLKSCGIQVLTNDVDSHHPTDLHLDVTRDWPTGKIAWVVTNPPFAHANIIVPKSFHAATDGVALLLRLSWLEPTGDRQDFLLSHPPTRLIVMPRYSFKRNGKSDSVTSAWFVWSKLVEPGISIVTKHERDELKKPLFE